MTWEKYLTLITDLHLEEKATSFQDNEEFYKYSVLGLSRMKRVFKKIDLTESLIQKVKSIDTPQTWMLITESWCGDASQTVPIIARLAEENEHIHLHIVLRDSHPELMEHFLTNGGKSIPILGILDAQNEEIGRWGPRPSVAQKMLMDYKAIPEIERPPYGDFSLSLQKWYNADKGLSTMSELEAQIP